MLEIKMSGARPRADLIVPWVGKEGKRQGKRSVAASLAGRLPLYGALCVAFVCWVGILLIGVV